MSPAETAMLVNVLVGAGIVFVIALLGNLISFSNRFGNAAVTALIFAVFYGALAYTVDRAMLQGEPADAEREMSALIEGFLGNIQNVTGQ